MKYCPNCGAILADNEPYCENCSFDPSFDMGDWDYGEYKSSGKPYLHGDHIKSSQNSQDDELNAIFGFLFLIVLVVCFLLYLQSYNWNIGLFIWSNLQSIFLLIVVIIVFSAACIYFNNL